MLYLCARLIIVELKINVMNNIESNTGEIVMYQPDETTVINRHINNVFKEGECDKESNVKITQWY
jgi:hypothetical protein